MSQVCPAVSCVCPAVSQVSCLKCVLQVISYSERRRHRDVHRFEKISNIIKQFKLSCSKMAASFQSMEVRNSSFAAFIDVFTTNTYIMVILSDPSIR